MVSGERSPGTNRFGQAVALYGNTAMVSAARDSISNPVVYVFEKGDSSWVKKTKLVASDGEIEFGSSIAMEGNIAVVGDPSTGNHAAYVFEKEGTVWRETAKLKIQDSSHSFGDAVDISGNTILVGSADKGAYVFEKTESGWTQVAELSTTYRGHLHFENDNWVAISDKYALVGSPDRGNVYTFTKPSGGWKDMTGVNQIIATERSENDLFGIAVALNSDAVLIGASQGSVSQKGQVGQSGKAYFFKAIADDIPPVVNDQTFTISKESLDSTFVGKVQVSDSDNDQHFFQFVDDSTNKFSVDPTTGEIHLEDESILNQADSETYNFTVAVGDGANVAYANITVELAIMPLSVINKEQLRKAYSIYPNPVIEKLTVKINDSEVLKERRLVIINSWGKKVLIKTLDASESTIDLSAYPPAIYLLKIEGANQALFRVVKK